MRKLIWCATLLLLWAGPRPGWGQPGAAFRVVPLGVKGGLDESNLSAYLVAPAGSSAYVCLDAGTLRYGLERAVANQVFPVPAAEVLRQYIKGYLISHPHLDHVAGLALNAPEDTVKPVYGTAFCLAGLQNSYFNWQAWPNFGDAGPGPTLRKYRYELLTPGVVMPLEHTAMQVQAYGLSHGAPYQSTAFLLRSANAYVLYLGDTGPDQLEKSAALHRLWQQVAPLIRAGTLKGIFLETSFADEQPDATLFGHLTPRWLLREMDNLSQLTGKKALVDLPLIITHLKPAGNTEARVKAQLMAGNKLKMKLIFPEQGQAFVL